MSDMLVKLYDLPSLAHFIEPLKNNGIFIRRAMAYEKQIVVQWVHNEFGTGWASECDIAFSNQPISCYIATKEGIIIGFACYDSTSKDFFGPTGVTEMARGQGVGKALLLVCLHAMRENGYAYAIIGAAGPAKFYTDTVGAMEIKGSIPGIYKDRLKEG